MAGLSWGAIAVRYSMPWVMAWDAVRFSGAGIGSRDSSTGFVSAGPTPWTACSWSALNLSSRSGCWPPWRQPISPASPCCWAWQASRDLPLAPLGQRHGPLMERALWPSGRRILSKNGVRCRPAGLPACGRWPQRRPRPGLYGLLGHRRRECRSPAAQPTDPATLTVVSLSRNLAVLRAREQDLQVVRPSITGPQGN